MTRFHSRKRPGKTKRLHRNQQNTIVCRDRFRPRFGANKNNNNIVFSYYSGLPRIAGRKPLVPETIRTVPVNNIIYYLFFSEIA